MGKENEVMKFEACVIECNVFIEHRTLCVQICHRGTLVFCDTAYESPVHFLKNLKYFVIELIDLMILRDALFVPSLDVSGSLACNRTGKGKAKNF